MMDFLSEAPDLISVGAQSLIDNAKRLGLTWDVRLATVIDGSITYGILAQYDGDDANIVMISLIGTLVNGTRVYVLEVPPSGNFIFGSAGNISQTGSEFIADTEATPSVVYTDLTTIGPTVTRSIGPSGSALVTVTTFVFNGTLGAVNWMGYEVSGATSLAASDDRALAFHSMVVNGQGRLSVVTHQTGLTPGVNTFTAKYRVNAGSGTYLNRQLIVTPTG